MALRAIAATVWNAPGDSTFLNSKFRPDDDRREALGAFAEAYHLDGALDSSEYWQTTDCKKDGFQSTDEAGVDGCRGTINNVACKSLGHRRADYERTQEILAANAEEMNVPDDVATYFGEGLDLDAAYAKAGKPLPGMEVELAAAARLAIDGLVASASRMIVGERASSIRRPIRAVDQRGISSHRHAGMTTGAAYQGGFVVSHEAFAASGAQPYVPTFEESNGPSAVAHPAASAALYQQAGAADMESTYQE